MSRVILKEVRTCRKEKVVLRTLFLTDVEVEGNFGDEKHIGEKVRLALQRTERDAPKCVAC